MTVEEVSGDNDVLGSLANAKAMSELILGQNNIIDSRAPSQHQDIALRLRQGLSFKQNEPTHRYFLNSYNIGRIAKRLNLVNDDKLLENLNRRISSVYPKVLRRSGGNARSFVSFPDPILKAAQTIKQNSISGFIENTGLSYITIDNKLFLFDYRETTGKEQFALLELQNQDEVIVSMCVTRVSRSSKEPALIFICTPLRVYIVQLEVSKLLGPRMKHFNPPLFCSTDGILFSSVVSTNDSRVFLGGSDGLVYKLNYHITSRKRKAGGVVGIIENFLPSNSNSCSVSSTSTLESVSNFLLPSVFKPSKVKKLVYDNERELLYVLFESEAISCYALIKSALNRKRVSFGGTNVANTAKSKNDKLAIFSFIKKIENLATKLGKHLQNPLNSVFICGVLAQDLRGRIEIVDICPVDDSDLIRAVVITKGGVRVYLSNELEIFHVRGPPKDIQNVQELDKGSQPCSKLKSSVTNVIYSSEGTLLVTNDMASSQLHFFSVDKMRRDVAEDSKSLDIFHSESLFHESVQVQAVSELLNENVKILGLSKVVDENEQIKRHKIVQRLSKSMQEELSEVLFDYTTVSKHKFLVMTSTGILTLSKTYPVDVLNSIFCIRQDATEGLEQFSHLKLVLLEDFFYAYGLVASCALFLLILSNPTDFGYVSAETKAQFFNFGFLSGVLPRLCQNKFSSTTEIDLNNNLLKLPANLDFSGCFLSFIKLIQLNLMGIWTMEVLKKQTVKLSKSAAAVEIHEFTLKNTDISSFLERLLKLYELKESFLYKYQQLVDTSASRDVMYSEMCKQERNLFLKTCAFLQRVIQGLNFLEIVEAKYANLVLTNVHSNDSGLRFKDLFGTLQGNLFVERVVSKIFNPSKKSTSLKDFERCPLFVSTMKANQICISKRIRELVVEEGHVDAVKEKSYIRRLLDESYEKIENGSLASRTFHPDESENRFFLHKTQILSLLGIFEYSQTSVSQSRSSLLCSLYDDVVLFSLNIAALFTVEQEKTFANDCFLAVFSNFIKFYKDNGLGEKINSLLTAFQKKDFQFFVYNFLFKSPDQENFKHRSLLGKLTASTLLDWFRDVNEGTPTFKDFIAKQELLGSFLSGRGDYAGSAEVLRTLALTKNDPREPVLNLEMRIDFMHTAIVSMKASFDSNGKTPSENPQSISPMVLEKELNLLKVQHRILLKLKLRQETDSEVQQITQTLSRDIMSPGELYNQFVYKFQMYEEGVTLLWASEARDKEEITFLYQKILESLVQIATTRNTSIVNNDSCMNLAMLASKFLAKGYFPSRQVISFMEANNSDIQNELKLVDSFIDSGFVIPDLLEIYCDLVAEADSVDVFFSSIRKLFHAIKKLKLLGVIGKGEQSGLEEKNQLILFKGSTEIHAEMGHKALLTTSGYKAVQRVNELISNLDLSKLTTTQVTVRQILMLDLKSIL